MEAQTQIRTCSSRHNHHYSRARLLAAPSSADDEHCEAACGGDDGPAARTSSGHAAARARVGHHPHTTATLPSKSSRLDRLPPEGSSGKSFAPSPTTPPLGHHTTTQQQQPAAIAAASQLAPPAAHAPAPGAPAAAPAAAAAPASGGLSPLPSPVVCVVARGFVKDSANPSLLDPMSAAEGSTAHQRAMWLRGKLLLAAGAGGGTRPDVTAATAAAAAAGSSSAAASVVQQQQDSADPSLALSFNTGSSVAHAGVECNTVGVFHPERYVHGEPCMEVVGVVGAAAVAAAGATAGGGGQLITCSQFEKLGGGRMARWYRSIYVTEPLQSLEKWLLGNGMELRLGGSRRSRKAKEQQQDDGEQDQQQVAAGAGAAAACPAGPVHGKHGRGRITRRTAGQQGSHAEENAPGLVGLLPVRERDHEWEEGTDSSASDTDWEAEAVAVGRRRSYRRRGKRSAQLAALVGSNSSGKRQLGSPGEGVAAELLGGEGVAAGWGPGGECWSRGGAAAAGGGESCADQQLFALVPLVGGPAHAQQQQQLQQFGQAYGFLCAHDKPAAFGQGPYAFPMSAALLPALHPFQAADGQQQAAHQLAQLQPPTLPPPEQGQQPHHHHHHQQQHSAAQDQDALFDFVLPEDFTGGLATKTSSLSSLPDFRSGGSIVSRQPSFGTQLLMMQDTYQQHTCQELQQQQQQQVRQQQQEQPQPQQKQVEMTSDSPRLPLQCVASLHRNSTTDMRMLMLQADPVLLHEQERQQGLQQHGSTRHTCEPPLTAGRDGRWPAATSPGNNSPWAPSGDGMPAAPHTHTAVSTQSLGQRTYEPPLTQLQIAPPQQQQQQELVVQYVPQERQQSLRGLHAGAVPAATWHVPSGGGGAAGTLAQPPLPYESAATMTTFQRSSSWDNRPGAGGRHVINRRYGSSGGAAVHNGGRQPHSETPWQPYPAGAAVSAIPPDSRTLLAVPYGAPQQGGAVAPLRHDSSRWAEATDLVMYGTRRSPAVPPAAGSGQVAPPQQLHNNSNKMQQLVPQVHMQSSDLGPYPQRHGAWVGQGTRLLVGQQQPPPPPRQQQQQQQRYAFRAKTPVPEPVGLSGWMAPPELLHVVEGGAEAAAAGVQVAGGRGAWQTRQTRAAGGVPAVAEAAAGATTAASPALRTGTYAPQVATEASFTGWSNAYTTNAATSNGAPVAPRGGGAHRMAAAGYEAAAVTYGAAGQQRWGGASVGGGGVPGGRQSQAWQEEEGSRDESSLWLVPVQQQQQQQQQQETRWGS